MAKLRLLLTAAFTWLAVRAAPKDLRPVMQTWVNLLATMPDELKSGREGGVAIIPWSITDWGRYVAELQCEACVLEARKVRKSLTPT